MPKVRWTGLLLIGLLPAPARAQDAGGFAVLRGSDTVAVEEFSRGPIELTGTLLRGTSPAAGDRVCYHAVLVDDQSAPLIELTLWRRDGTDSVPMPFFNLSGGQTVVGSVRRLGTDSALVVLGTVEFRLQVDGQGRILGGTLPAQGLRIIRHGAS